MMQNENTTGWRTTTLSRDCYQCGLDQHRDYANGLTPKLRRKASHEYTNHLGSVYYLCRPHAEAIALTGQLAPRIEWGS